MITTIKDVARAAGVSVATASKALSGKGSLRDETIKRVLTAAQMLNYIPNRLAQALPRKQLKIGIMVSSTPIEVSYYIQEGIRQGIAEFSEYGAAAILSLFDMYTVQSLDRQYDEIADQVDGLICSGVKDRILPGRLEEFIQKGKYVVSLLSPSGMNSLISDVSVDGFVVGRMAAQYIANCRAGRETAVISGRKNVELHELNIDGFLTESREYGLNCVEVSYCNDEIKQAYHNTIALLQKFPGVTGIFTTSYVAPGICDALKALGKEREICVVGLDLYRETIEALQDGSLNAVIFQNQVQQGKTAVRKMLELISGGKNTVELIRPELVLKSNLSCYLHMLTEDYTKIEWRS